MRFTIEGTFEEIKGFISNTVLKTPDPVFLEESISEHGYGDKIYQKLEEKLRKKDSVHIPAQASDKDLDRKKRKINSVLQEITPGAPLEDRIEPDHHLDIHGGVD